MEAATPGALLRKPEAQPGAASPRRLARRGERRAAKGTARKAGASPAPPLLKRKWLPTPQPCSKRSLVQLLPHEPAAYARPARHPGMAAPTWPRWRLQEPGPRLARNA